MGGDGEDEGVALGGACERRGGRGEVGDAECAFCTSSRPRLDLVLLHVVAAVVRFLVM